MEERLKNYKCSNVDEKLQECCPSCIELVFSLKIFKMATFAMEMQKRRQNGKWSKLDEHLQKCLIIMSVMEMNNNVLIGNAGSL